MPFSPFEQDDPPDDEPHGHQDMNQHTRLHKRLNPFEIRDDVDLEENMRANEEEAEINNAIYKERQAFCLQISLLREQIVQSHPAFQSEHAHSKNHP
jgi:hypothetical protein